MKLDFLTVLINISVLMLLGVPGYIFRKKNIIGEGGTKPLVILLLYITQPFLIIMSFQGEKYSPDILGSMGIVFVFAVIIHFIMLFLAKIIFAKFNIDKSKKGVYIFASAFSNCGYIGIPVITALFYDSPYLSVMLMYLSVYIVVFNIINWTVGIYIISGDKKYISIKNALINPTTLALVVALPLFFLGITLKDYVLPIANAFNMIGNMTTPVSLIILGIKLAEMPIKDLFTTKLVYLTSALKLLIMPLIMLGIMLLFNTSISKLIIYVLVIVTAMPVATLTVANAERFGGDSYTAAKCMLCSTILSIFTIPAVCLLL